MSVGDLLLRRICLPYESVSLLNLFLFESVSRLNMFLIEVVETPSSVLSLPSFQTGINSSSKIFIHLK